MTPGLTVLGCLGTQLDRARGSDRWSHWRPTVSLFQQEDLLVTRFVLLTERRFDALTEQIVADIASVSPETVVETHELALRDPWDFEEVFAALWRFCEQFRFDPEHEDYLVHLTTGTHVLQICLFLLAETRRLPARLLQTSPPQRDAPHGRYQIIDLDLSRYDRLAQRFAEEQAVGAELLKSGIATRSESFNRLIQQIERVALGPAAPILLVGPTGAGKSQLARRIHDLRKHRHLLAGPFVEVNCATLRGDAAHSTLFGHVKGAFTGAAADRPGLLRAADRGTLFLDEIGELGLDEQAMLLRALEDKRFLPLGADVETGSDFQLLAGTNRDLARAVAEGRFREDLLARIKLWTFRLPGLRERLEDLEPNLDYELARHRDRTGQSARFNAQARAQYLEFAHSAAAAWRANFRDLSGSITRLCTLARGGRITVDDVQEETERLVADWSASAAPVDRRSADDALLARVLAPSALADLDRFERVQLAEVVRTCQAAPSLSAAGRELFAASLGRRASSNDADRLRKYLARHGLEFASLRVPAAPNLPS